MSVRNARGNDSSQQSAQFGHKAKLFYAKERYKVYIYIYLYGTFSVQTEYERMYFSFAPIINVSCMIFSIDVVDV